MTDNIIGVIGAGGAVGKFAASQLISDGYKCRVTSRNGVIDDFMVGSAECIKLDIYDSDALKEFCSKVDIVLNCAGPSYIIGSRVAKIALQQNCDYIDAFGVTIFSDETIKKLSSKKACILGAGSVPGLSGVAVSELSGHFDKCDKLEFYSYGMEKATKTSMIDVLLSSIKDYGYPDRYYSRGSIILENPREEPVEVFGSSVAMSDKAFLYNEMVRAAKQCGINELHSYNLIPDESLQSKMIEEMASYMLKPDRETLDLCAEKLCKMTEVFMFGREPEYLISLLVSGISGGIEKQVEMCIKMKNSFKATGITAAVTAEMTAETDKKGMYWAYELIDGKALINKLITEEACSVLYRDSSTADEEGEI